MGNEFIGRSAELDRVRRFLDDPKHALGVVYGRRRIGKSRLLTQALRKGGCPSVFFECRQSSDRDNADKLLAAMEVQLGLPRMAFQRMEEVLEYLFNPSLGIFDPKTSKEPPWFLFSCSLQV